MEVKPVTVKETKKIAIRTSVKRMLADVYTPVGIYLRLRDRFRDTILLESADHHGTENSYSFICVNAMAGIEIRDKNVVEFKLPNRPPEKISLDKNLQLKDLLWNFMQRFETTDEGDKAAAFAQGLYGYFSFDAVQFIESVRFNEAKDQRS